MALDGMDKLVARLALYSPIVINKASIANMAAGNWASLWRATGVPTQANTPTTAENPTSSTLGALTPLPTPGSGETLYLAGLWAVCSNATTLFVVDRLGQMGGLNGTLTTAQTVNLGISTPASQGRCATDGSDVRWFLEWYVDTGSSAVTATASYTNQSGTSGRTSQTISLPATRRAGMLYEILPATGDLSIRSVESVTLSATTGTAGNFGVTALKFLGTSQILTGNLGMKVDGFALGFPEIKSNSCVSFVVFCTTTSTGTVNAEIKIIAA